MDSQGVAGQRGSRIPCSGDLTAEMASGLPGSHACPAVRDLACDTALDVLKSEVPGCPEVWTPRGAFHVAEEKTSPPRLMRPPLSWDSALGDLGLQSWILGFSVLCTEAGLSNLPGSAAARGGRHREGCSGGQPRASPSWVSTASRQHEDPAHFLETCSFWPAGALCLQCQPLDLCPLGPWIVGPVVSRTLVPLGLKRWCHLGSAWLKLPVPVLQHPRHWHQVTGTPVSSWHSRGAAAALQGPSGGGGPHTHCTWGCTCRPLALLPALVPMLPAGQGGAGIRSGLVRRVPARL